MTNCKGITFATGTPVSNSMSELFVNMKYLQPDVLQEMQCSQFDQWAANFGSVVTAMEFDVTGQKFHQKSRFAEFFNLPELMSAFKESADVRTPDMLQLKVPEHNTHTVAVEPSDFQLEVLDNIVQRCDQIRDGSVNPQEDNMLKVTTDGRLLAFDQRLYDPVNAPDNPNSKINKCVEVAFDIYQKGTMVSSIVEKDPWEVAVSRTLDGYVTEHIEEEDMDDVVNNFLNSDEYKAADLALTNNGVRECIITGNLDKIAESIELSEGGMNLYAQAETAASVIHDMAYNGDLSKKEESEIILASLTPDKFPEDMETRMNHVLDLLGDSEAAKEAWIMTPFGAAQVSELSRATNIDNGFSFHSQETGLTYTFHADVVSQVASDKGEFFEALKENNLVYTDSILMTYGNDKQGYDVALWNEPDGSSKFAVADAGKLQSFIGKTWNDDGMLMAMGNVPPTMIDKELISLSNTIAQGVTGESLEGYEATIYSSTLSDIAIPDDSPVDLPVQAEFGEFSVHFADNQIAESFAEAMMDEIPDMDVSISTREMSEENMDKLMENTKDIYAYGTSDHGYVSFAFDKDEQSVTATRYDAECTPYAQEKVVYMERNDFAEQAANFSGMMFISKELENPAFDNIDELHWINTEQFVADVENHEDNVRSAVNQFDSLKPSEKYEAIFRDDTGKIVATERFDSLEDLSMQSVPENGSFEVRESGKSVVKGDIDDNMRDIIAEVVETDADRGSYDQERAALGLDRPATNEEVAHDIAEILYAHSDKDISLEEIEKDVLFKIEDSKEHPENLDALINRLDKLYDLDRPTLQENIKIYTCEERLDSIKESQKNQESTKDVSEPEKNNQEQSVQNVRKGNPQQDDLVTKQQNPLNKVEELEEGNYNQIDGIINNLPPKKGLKEVVEDKKEVVSERSNDKQEHEKTTTHKHNDRDSI